MGAACPATWRRGTESGGASGDVHGDVLFDECWGWWSTWQLTPVPRAAPAFGVRMHPLLFLCGVGIRGHPCLVEGDETIGDNKQPRCYLRYPWKHGAVTVGLAILPLVSRRVVLRVSLLYRDGQQEASCNLLRALSIAAVLQLKLSSRTTRVENTSLLPW